MSDKEESAFKKAWAKIVQKAWNDDAFKQKLLKNPEAVLKEYGIEKLPAPLEVHENTATKIHLIIPPKPMGELTEEQLKNVAGGISWTFDDSSGPWGRIEL